MASRNRPKRAAVRGKSAKTHYASGLTEIVSETVRLCRKHHLGYDQTKYVVEQARRRLKLQSPATRRRTVNRLDKSEVERLIRSTYQSHNKYGLMIKTLFLSGARVDEFVHIRIEDLHLDDDPPQIFLSHCKKESNRYVPVLPALAQELRTHLNGRRRGYLFETNRHGRYSVRTLQSVVKSEARQAGIDKRVYPHLLRHSIATILLDSGEVPIDQVQKFLGHLQLSTTQI
jgi:integrase/recombinase XerD